MTYFLSAADEDSADTLHAEIEADSFEDAFEELRRRARARWPGRIWRPTCIVERPDRAPIGLAIDISTRRMA